MTLTNYSLASTLNLGGTFTGAVNTYTSGSRPGGQTTVDTFNFSGNGNYNITGSFADVPASSMSSMDHVAAVAVVGTGQVTLSGPPASANPFSGGVTVNNAGTLVLNYATNSTVIPTGSPLTLGRSGILHLVGNPGSTTTTAQTIGNPNFLSTPSTIIVDNNGGSGTTLTLGNSWTIAASGTTGATSLVNFDLSSGGVAQLSSPSLVSGSTSGTTYAGVISSPTGTNAWIGRADYSTSGNYVAVATVKSTDGNTYVATLNSTGQIVPQTTLTNYAVDDAGNQTSGTTNYLINGNLTLSQPDIAGTIRIAPTSAGQSLNIGGNAFPNVYGQLVLLDGSNDYTISNYSSLNGTVNFDVVGTGKLILNSAVTVNPSSSSNLVKSGPGTLVINANESADTRKTAVVGGVLQVADPSYLPTGLLSVNNAVLELGSAAGNNTFTRSLGTGAGQFNVISSGSAGFSAIGGNITVNLGGGSPPSAITFGASFFVGSGNSKLLFSSPNATGTVNFANPLNLNGTPQTIQVARGSAPVDANLTGALTNGSLIKTGPGVLKLSGSNTFTGGTVVNQGTLMASTASALGTGPVVLAGGTLAFNAPAVAGALLPQNQLSPVGVSGYNQDVIRGVSAPAAGVTLVGLGASNDTLYEQGTTLGPDYYNEPAPAGAGLPVNTPAGRTFVSGTNANTTFQLQDYTQNNGLTTLTPTTLTLTTPASFTKLAFLDASPDNTNTYDAVLNFTDGSSTTISSISVADWGTKGAAALSAGGRATVGGNFDQGNAPYYATNLFEYDYTLSPTDQQKTVASITFQNGSQQYYSNPPGQTAEILAVSGGTPSVLAGSQTTVYANDITATGASSIDLSSALTRVSYVQAVTVTGSLAITGAHNAISVGALSLSGTSGAWSSKLDLGANDLIVRSGNFGQVANQVAQGYNNGSWNAAGGIVSKAAASDPSHLTALGVIQNSVDGTPTGTVLHSTFDGTPALASDVLVKYTYYGDTTLKGYVDGSDYSRIDNGYLSHLTGWANGDFNYDGVVNGSDYTLIDNAFNTQGASLATEVATSTAQIAGLGGSSAVPEPGTIGLIVIGAAGVLGRRRRSH